jgi:hypothetical protein
LPNLLKNKLMKIRRMSLPKKIQQLKLQWEMVDNGLLICQKVFKMVEMVNNTGLIKDQDHSIGIINMLIEFMRKLKLQKVQLMLILNLN